MGIFKKVGGRLVDVRIDKWMSWDYLSDTANRFKLLTADIMIPKKPTYSETFEEAMQRLELTEEDVVQRKKEFKKLFYFFLVLGCAIIAYALYLAYKASIVPCLIAFCIAMYALTQAFRFHFWHFQLKYRKLGCTLQEWLNSKVYQEPHQDLVPQKTQIEKPLSSEEKAEE